MCGALCLLVVKAHGEDPSCTDFRKVNSVTKPDSYPLPCMEDCVDRGGGGGSVCDKAGPPEGVLAGATLRACKRDLHLCDPRFFSSSESWLLGCRTRPPRSSA